MKNIIIVGGGPAGMLAGITAARQGACVTLFEKNEKLGKKLRITGKGRCNITNAIDINDFFVNIPRNPKFLYSALYSFTNDDIIKLLNDNGVATKVERGNRVFPVSDSAGDVTRALVRSLKNAGAKIVNERVSGLLVEDGKICGLKTASKHYSADAVILATGGLSYPLTGSTGDGLRYARDYGHRIVEPVPSLIPIVTNEQWPSSVMGLSLKNVTLTAYNEKGKAIHDEFGEMLFTHFGLSGPIVLSLSAHLKEPTKNNYTIKIDLKPALDAQKLDKRILRDFEGNTNKQLINALGGLLPKAIIPVVIKESGLDEHMVVNELTKEQRHSLVETIKGLKLTVKGFRPIEEAIITSGGVSVKDINPSTMESKLISGLYFAGEIIDVDAYTGGFNLQIAYSTGYLAGLSASEKEDV